VSNKTRRNVRFTLPSNVIFSH